MCTCCLRFLVGPTGNFGCGATAVQATFRQATSDLDYSPFCCHKRLSSAARYPDKCFSIAFTRLPFPDVMCDAGVHLV